MCYLVLLDLKILIIYYMVKMFYNNSSAIDSIPSRFGKYSNVISIFDSISRQKNGPQKASQSRPNFLFTNSLTKT